MPNGQTRYHAEVKVTMYGREARINIFADTLNEIYLDLANICEQIPDEFRSAGHREIANAELKAKQLQKDGLLPDKVAKKLAPKAPTTPVCVNCGSTNTELIRWADKVTQEAKSAWKCQDCKQWLPNAK
jgi:hypothetical protein